MSPQTVDGLAFDFLGSKPIELELSTSPLTSDAGLLPIRQFDERIRLTEQFTNALVDPRVANSTVQSRAVMVRQRIFGIIADYMDQNDHDTLRTDPVFKLLAGREPTGTDLASQPTLSRFENSISIDDLWRLREFLIQTFIQSFPKPPTHLTFDMDAFDDPTHGHQQLTMFHGYYEQYQYLPIAITCAENDAVVLIGLRHGTCHAALGVDDDLRYIAARLREVWPDVQITVRGDSGFGVPMMYDVSRELNLWFTYGIGMNPRLKALSDELLVKVQKQFEETGVPQREFIAAEYKAGSWPESQRIVIKVEYNEQGSNRRAVVTNRDGWKVLPSAIYDDYALRGESENRNKELKCELKADRLSDHRFMANFFRLYLHVTALNLMIRLRQATARPEPAPAEVGVYTPEELPAESLDEPQRKTFFNRRRVRDVMAEGFASTWRTRLIKVAAEIVVRARRVIVRLSSSWPHLDELTRITEIISRIPVLILPTD
ncbi:MAG: IS1380 family transposase [Planctomycetota bacterium]|nr:IS1380 family transposase [Planctomycetota bacterium]